MAYNDIHIIEKLIEAFYEGNTTPQEEKILYDFFSQKDIPMHLQKEKVFFQELYSIQAREIPVGMEERIETLIERLAEEEQENIVAIPASGGNMKPINWRWIGGIAASLFIILSVGIFTYNQKFHHRNHMVDTFSDPKEAYLETEKALLLVSNKLNKGFDQMGNAQKNIQKTNKIVEKNVQL
ncbi:MAG: hypothetical protein E6772_12290 [Dysgonomonas sp.]|nr:hypothetical protein [Dysgonomonas sp.]